MTGKPGYLTWDRLPPGVEPLLFVVSSGLTLVQCRHHTLVQRVGYPDEMCVICKVTADRTEGFALPVKLLAVVPEESTLF